MNKILVVANKENDLLRLLKASCDVTVIGTEDICFDIEAYGALCILAGDEDDSLILPAPLQVALEKMRQRGKPVFCEFLRSLGLVRKRAEENVNRKRMVFRPDSFAVQGMHEGDLLDAQSNLCLRYGPMPVDAAPILTYQEHICSHSNLQIDAEGHKAGTWALWWLDKTTLISSIRLCNFHRARFAPRERWQALITSIVSFLAGERVEPTFDPPVYTYSQTKVSCVEDTIPSIRRGLDWITNAGILKRGGVGGAYEGFSSRIFAQNGVQARNNSIRTDCTCEIGGALLFDSILTGNTDSKAAADALFKFAFECMQVKEGDHKGMLRWSEEAWSICFQDDAARAILPLLLCQHLGRDVPYLEKIKEALDYMLATTGENGMRRNFTEIHGTFSSLIDEVKKENTAKLCAHYNAFYSATLLLAYRVCGKREYLQCAETGLSALMSLFPDTVRETSETEECCRLILPLAILYGVTKKREHYDWLCSVVDALEKYRHPSGGYMEWDTGYQAFCSRNHNGECALLANNGDPIADLLYSNNWLPLGFAYAYLVTGEARFYELWRSVAAFLLSSQMHSEDKNLDGAWARAFDMDICETYGMPHDIGWGPYCIESGWTVGEILMGLQFMQAIEGGKAKP